MHAGNEIVAYVSTKPSVTDSYRPIASFLFIQDDRSGNRYVVNVGFRVY